MERNELRINNSIDVGALHCPYGIGEVAEILADCVLVRINGSYHQYLYDDIQGIPLTKEWLIRFGLKNTQIGLFEMEVFPYGEINIHISKLRLLVELGTKGGYLFGNTKIQYVHQLQNLYHALTGQELKQNDK